MDDLANFLLLRAVVQVVEVVEVVEIVESISRNGTLGVTVIVFFRRLSSLRSIIVAQIMMLSQMRQTSDPASNFFVLSESSILKGRLSNSKLNVIGEHVLELLLTSRTVTSPW